MLTTKEAADKLGVSTARVRQLVEAICKGIEKRIDTVNFWARHAPSNKLPAEYAAQTETLDWVWL